MKSGENRMNYVWTLGTVISYITAIVRGTAPQTVAAVFEAAQKSVEVILSLAGMICFWSGILEIAERGGLTKKLENILFPFVRLLFPKLKKGSPASKRITENIAANLLGTGNAATPAGIAAMKELDKINPHPEKPTAQMCIFTVINTSSLQLVPTTVIALRAASGAANAAEILPIVWISSALSLIAAVVSMKIILKLKRENL